ncbi:GSCFA domain-containing protein [Sphingobium mellinum]|uniref:GSCFA domain-containing protein n=1 Tax=Sphingobium mellinum TaxID=1387166 RepID=UPI0030EDA423
MTTPPFSRVFDFSRTDQAMTLKGFFGTERTGRWSDGAIAHALLHNETDWPQALAIEIEASPFVPNDVGRQSVAISVNGAKVGDFAFERHLERVRLDIPISLDRTAANKPLEIDFEIDKPSKPANRDMSEDTRDLGLFVFNIKVNGREASGRQNAGNPYKGLPEHQFWRRSISAVESFRVDPVTNPRFRISQNARVGTAGSCFAQHISRRISAAGFNYFVTEKGEMLDERERAPNNYGTFSARYGNIYTTVQLLQLFDEAFGMRTPAETAWIRPDGRFVDPYRQQVQPNGFASEEAVLADRRSHLAAVRRLFEDTDIFVFTLGLTETWQSKEDGSVFSAAPGVVGGGWDADRYEFINLDLEQTYGALEEFLDKFHAINPNAKVLLTVSPVPLIATYEPRSVLVSTVYSKSVLRVASEKALKRFDWVDYFPSFEIITGSSSGGLYYEADYREVNMRGVSHVMRCFMRHYIEGSETEAPELSREIATNSSMSTIICDEEILDKVRN